VRAIAGALLLVLALPAAAAAEPRYTIDLRLDPAARRWSATVDATGVACNGDIARIHLHRDIAISKASVDGRVVTPRFDPPDAPEFWIRAARAIDLPCPKKKLTLTYYGPGQLHPDGRNQVGPDLVELSLYGGWYPLVAIDDRISWTLTTRLPPGWTYATPATAIERRARGGPALRLTSPRPSDVVLIASPHFIVTPATDGSITARVFLSDRPPPDQQQRAVALGREGAATAAWLQGLLGPADPAMTLRPDIVFTPRGGPLSYARLPLIVLPEATLGEADGDRPLALNVRHEIAHFWSRSKGASNDWINEGLAEYLAVVRTGDVEGRSAREALIARYRAENAAAGPGAPITGDDDARGYIIRYVRPALMLDAAEMRVGRARMATFLRALAALGDRLDTATFGQTAADMLGSSEAAILSTCLAARDWPAPCGG
jgi:hypothetical protein